MTLVYLDTETTGLNPLRHQVWEIAYAVNDGPVVSGVVEHSLESADPKALEVNSYWGRIDRIGKLDEEALRAALEGATIVGANPAFDAAFLATRWDCWGAAPWRYRMVDIESVALTVFGWGRPRGLAEIAEAVTRTGLEIGPRDRAHTAAVDVAVTRGCYLAMRYITQARQVG